MKEILSVFNMNIDTEIKSKLVNSYYDVNLSGTTEVTKGDISWSIAYYARVDTMQYPNCINLWDLDFQEETMKIGNVPIDDVNQFIHTLQNSGLTTASKQFEITFEEKKKAVLESLKEEPMLKKIFGEDFILFDLLPCNRKRMIELEFICNSFDNCGESFRKQVYEYFVEILKWDNEKEFVPTLDVFKVMHSMAMKNHLHY